MFVSAIVYVCVDPPFCKIEDNFWFWCLQVKVKIKYTLEQATRAQRWSRGIASTLSLTSALDWGWVVSATPRPLYPRERLGTHCVGG